MEQIPDRPDYFIDHFGVVWNRTVDKDIGIVDCYQMKAPDLSTVPALIPTFDRAEPVVRLEQLMQQPATLFRIANLGFSRCPGRRRPGRRND
jgi:hypothetical protein